jgi:hypothetical protein
LDDSDTVTVNVLPTLYVPLDGDSEKAALPLASALLSLLNNHALPPHTSKPANATISICR